MQRLLLEQKSMDKWGVIGIASFVLSIVSFFLWLEMNMKFGTPAFVGLAFAIFCYVKYLKRNDTFVDDFKESIIKQIIDHICPGIVYNPGSCVSEQEYKTSSLFRLYYDDYTGEDYMEGVYKNVTFCCSQLQTKYEDTSTIFKGLFL